MQTNNVHRILKQKPRRALAMREEQIWEPVIRAEQRC